MTQQSPPRQVRRPSPTARPGIRAITTIVGVSPGKSLQRDAVKAECAWVTLVDHTEASNDQADRRGWPVASELYTAVAGPRSVQRSCQGSCAAPCLEAPDEPGEKHQYCRACPAEAHG